MADGNNSPNESAATTNPRAEALLLDRRPKPLEALSPEDAQRMLHELQVHQIQLEAQNAEMQRRLAEIDASRARYFDLYDLAPVGYVTVGENGVILEANRCASRLLGLSRSELIDHPFTHFIAPEDQDTFSLDCKQLREKTVPQTAELRVLARDRGPFWAHLTATLATGANGVSELRIVLTDISERRNAHEALTIERNLLRAVLDLLPTWIFVKDRESRFLVANQACANHMGAASTEEIIGKTDADFNPPETAARLRREELDVLNGTPLINREVIKKSPDGSKHVLLIHKVPLRDPNGAISGLAGAGFDITQQKEAEEELRANELFLRDILNSLPAHIAVLDSAGLILEVNEPWLQYARANGAKPIETIGVGANYLQVCKSAWQDGDAYAQAAVTGLESVLLGEQNRFTLEYPCDSPECTRWFAMEVLKPLGGRVGAIVAHTDISERKRTDESLRDANQKLRLHFEQTPMAVIEWDLDFRVTQWNPAAQTIFGHTQKEALGKHASFIVPEPFRHLVNGIFQALLTKTGGERSTNPNVSKDGTPILCEWYNTALIDEHGNVAGVASVVMDITEQTEALQLLAWEKSAMELIGSLTPLHEVLDGLMQSLEKQLPGALCSVLLLDDDGVHLRHGAAPSLPHDYNQAIDGQAISPAAGSCGTAAYAKKQIIVVDIASDPLWADYREVALKHGLRACWSTPIFSHGKVLGTFAIYYHEARHPTTAELEMVERAVHVVRLAIKRKLAEEEIRSLNSSLERRVEERTAELEAANKELESFTYSVSHDLRAPLRAVDGFSQMVIEDYAALLDADGQRMLGVIRSETQRMGRLIVDLLAFSRMGREPIEPIPIDMSKLAQAVFNELAAGEPERKLRLDMHPLPVARGSDALIRQVWVNLISNAIKFTSGRDRGEIEIGARQDKADQTVYYVKDNGAGFDMRYANKLFGIFQRLHSQQEFSGTGVGLALVQRLIQRHGGRVWAESEVDHGATFYFTLPNLKS